MGVRKIGNLPALGRFLRENDWVDRKWKKKVDFFLYFFPFLQFLAASISLKQWWLLGFPQMLRINNIWIMWVAFSSDEINHSFNFNFINGCHKITKIYIKWGSHLCCCAKLKSINRVRKQIINWWCNFTNMNVRL